MKDYDVWFMWICKCGRVHTIREKDRRERINLEFHAESFICGCTECYSSIIIPIEPDPIVTKINYADGMTPYRIMPVYLNEAECVDYIFFFDEGVRIPLLNGGYANAFHPGRRIFYNYEYMMKVLQTNDIKTGMVRDIFHFKVDTDKLIHQNRHDHSFNKAFSKLPIEMADWSRTVYAGSRFED